MDDSIRLEDIVSSFLSRPDPRGRFPGFLQDLSFTPHQRSMLERTISRRLVAAEIALIHEKRRLRNRLGMCHPLSTLSAVDLIEPLEEMATLSEYSVSIPDHGQELGKAIEELKGSLEILLETVPHRTAKGVERALNDWAGPLFPILTSYN